MTRLDDGGSLTVGLRQIAMPVAVVAAAHESRRSCATATVMYGSVDPPTVVTSLASSSTTLALATQAGRFVLSVLAATQEPVAVTAGRRASGPDKFDALGIAALDAGPAEGLGLPGALTVLVCDVLELVVAGDHRCVIGSVHDVVPGRADLRPLLRFRRGYALLEHQWAVDRTYPI